MRSERRANDRLGLAWLIFCRLRAAYFWLGLASSRAAYFGFIRLLAEPSQAKPSQQSQVKQSQAEPSQANWLMTG